MTSHRTLAASALAATALLAGCGGGGGDSSGSPEDRAAVTKVVEGWARSTDDKAVCDTYFSARLVKAIYGSTTACRRNAGGDDQKPDKVEVSDVKVDGSSATAQLEASDETLALDGDLRLVKDGSTWRIDEFGDDFVRGLIAAALGAGAKESIEENSVADGAKLFEQAGIDDCLDDRLEELPAERTRGFAYAIIGERDTDAYTKPLQDTLRTCLKRDDARPLLLALGEAGISQRLGVLGPCVVKRLRSTVEDELTDLAAAGVEGRTPSAAGSQKVSQAAQTAAQACAEEQGRTPGG